MVEAAERDFDGAGRGKVAGGDDRLEADAWAGVVDGIAEEAEGIDFVIARGIVRDELAAHADGEGAQFR